MGYVPYTGGKDYFEEPLTGADLVLKFTNDGFGSYTITAIEETDIAKLGLVPPSSRIGVTYGKIYDLIKIFIPQGKTGDTVQIFTTDVSYLPSVFSDSISIFLKKAWTNASNASTKGTFPPYPSELFVGKILRVDMIPLSDGSSNCAVVVTLLLYV